MLSGKTPLKDEGKKGEGINHFEMEEHVWHGIVGELGNLKKKRTEKRTTLKENSGIIISGMS